MLKKIAMFQSRGSGWRLHSIIQLDIYTIEYDPMRATKHIPLPKKLDKQEGHDALNRSPESVSPQNEFYLLYYYCSKL